MPFLNHVLQIASITVLAVTALFLILNVGHAKHLWAGIGLVLSIVCYLIVEEPVIRGTILWPIALTGSICIPVFFWLLARSIFEDHFALNISVLPWFALQVIPHAHHFLKWSVSFPELLTLALDIVTQLISLAFVLAAIYVVVRTRKTDLVEERLRFRNTFITITGLTIGITLIVEATAIARESKDFLQILQRSAILGLTILFLIRNFNFQPGFFFREIPKPKPANSSDPALEEELMKLLREQRIYRKEGLTIKELADLAKTQEHRLRRLINVTMGFKNFNDFLNQYRVNEACEILSDPSQNQKTILEIAYYLGYQSIGPFNKAFREQKGTTPTAYRKAQNS